MNFEKFYFKNHNCNPFQSSRPLAISLRGRRLKGMGKGVLGTRETRGGAWFCVVSRPNSLPLPFRTPATQAIWLFVAPFVFAVLFIPSFHVLSSFFFNVSLNLAAVIHLL